VLPGPKRVVYVSCDTATLARDLRLATAKGYRVDRLIGFDMFPQTAHLESLVRLVRA
jgi:23S rRNA (uracil1939-C5)-methyltransferase